MNNSEHNYNSNPEANTQNPDTAAIASILQQLVAAWNRGDGTAYGKLFTPDADYIDVTGTHTKGGPAIGQLHQFLFEGTLKGSQLGAWDLGTGTDLSFLSPEVALVISGGNSSLEGQTEAPDDRRSVNTTVLVKQSGQWLIRAFQNNRVQSMPFARPVS